MSDKRYAEMSEPAGILDDGQALKSAMVTPKQAAEKVGVSPALVYQWCKAGQLEHYRFGAKGKRGKLLIDPVVLGQFMEAHRQAALPSPVGLKHIQLATR